MSTDQMKTDSSVDNWHFIDRDATFRLHNPHLTNHLFFPLVNEAGMMSIVTPTLNGDIKTGQHTFFSTPVSVDDLHNSRSARNFWVFIEGHGPWSLTGNSAQQIAQRFKDGTESTELEAGLLWHAMRREHHHLNLKAEIVNFVPSGEDQVEMMRVTITNTGDQTRELVPTAAIPVFGRSADNLRDHRHVTSLLHRTFCDRYGVLVRPTLSFDERGHIPNTRTYAVLGCDDQKRPPEGFFPVLEDFIGEGGNLDWPQMIVLNRSPEAEAGDMMEGYEAIGGLRFSRVRLQPGESCTWVLVLAIFDKLQNAAEIQARYLSTDRFNEWFNRTRDHWKNRLTDLEVQTGDSHFNNWMRWVSVQPVLRRLYGNSFMPYHDYGRGGRGWRDLWQDHLALLLTRPEEVKDILLGNYAGVRFDGSNATIIGSNPGEFKADRNDIPRVWMDHGAWPLLTTCLYINQTGDLDFLLREQTYFKDHHVARSKEVDSDWKPEQGTALKTADGQIYRGTVFEHLLVQHLTMCYNVGEHNLMRLENADWNDGLDMAGEHGESAAMTALYAGNLLSLAKLARHLHARGHGRIKLAEELIPLLIPQTEEVPAAKQAYLERYFEGCYRTLSGKQSTLSTKEVAERLEAIAGVIINRLHNQEWIRSKTGHEWFNGYYDDDGQHVEGDHPLGLRMTLTGQTFHLLGRTATPDQVEHILRAVQRFLHDPAVGGIRLNTNFREVKQNLGRAFGFAFGHKENGAMFSHMAVMYAYGLYQYGKAREAFRVLDEIFRHSLKFPVSRMYPGIPEYFNARGRGMYPYLTGSASWYMLTLVTQAFGVRGLLGDLLLAPQLVREQFDDQDRATIRTLFAGRHLQVSFFNPQKLDPGEYMIHSVQLDHQTVLFSRKDEGVLLPKTALEKLQPGVEHSVEILLGAKQNLTHYEEIDDR